MSKGILLVSLLGLCALTIGGCDASTPPTPRAKPVITPSVEAPEDSAPAAAPAVHTDWTDKTLPFAFRLSAAAEERATHPVRYDAAYVRIPYPMGDVPPDQGVCSDEVIRAYRLVGVDLQKLVHEDMARAFKVYPKRWQMASPDANIDHRRVPNLAMFFTRHGQSLPVTQDGDDYKPGDVVAWELGGGRPHIGLVTEQRSGDGKRPLVLHNIGWGPHIEDMLFELKITGHYRYDGPKPRKRQRRTNGLGAPRLTR